MSNFPLPPLPLSHQFSAVTGLQYLACILSEYLNSPTLFRHSFSGPKNSPQHFFSMYLHVSSFRFNVWASPLISQQLFALIRFQYRTFPSPYVPLNFLHPCRFIRILPPLASPPLLTCFCCFNIRISPASTTSCMHLEKRRRQGPKTSSPM